MMFITQTTKVVKNITIVGNASFVQLQEFGLGTYSDKEEYSEGYKDLKQIATINIAMIKVIYQIETLAQKVYPLKTDANGYTKADRSVLIKRTEDRAGVKIKFIDGSEIYGYFLEP